jgi:hypothetical protein
LIKPKSEEEADVVKKFDSFQKLKQNATTDAQGNVVLPKETGKEALKRIFVEEKGAPAIPFISGAVDMKEFAQVASAYKKLEFGTADNIDMMRLNNFIDEKFSELIRGYESLRKFSDAEKNFLKIALVGAAMRFLLTRLHGMFFTPKDSLIKIKNPQEYLAKLRFFKSKL